MFMTSLKISPFGEIHMTPGAQQKLLICLKNTTAALVAFRATSFEHEDMIVQKLTDVILPTDKLIWEEAVESAGLEQPLTGAHNGVGTASLTWRVLRAFLRCYDNPHDFNEMVHIWTQAAQ